MSRIILESLWPVNPYIDPNAFVKFTFILASKAATNNNHSLKIGKYLGLLPIDINVLHKSNLNNIF